MLKILATRLKQGHRTVEYPRENSELTERFRGRPLLYPTKCQENCQACVDACPVEAISKNPLTIDLGKCLLCANCMDACPSGAIAFSSDYERASRTREGLMVTGVDPMHPEPLDKNMRKLLGRSLKLRQVSAAGCNICEGELVATGNIEFDIGRLGIQFVASPRHADGILVTGPVSTNMEYALRQTYEATPAPKIVIACGSCAISGGPFAGSKEVRGIPRDIPIDLFIPGCPPHPLTLLDAIHRLIGGRQSG